jgi:hypothetical protein
MSVIAVAPPSRPTPRATTAATVGGPTASTTPVSGFDRKMYVLPLYGEYICYKTEDSKIKKKENIYKMI